MDDTGRNRRTPLYIILVILGLVMSCGIGALLGGTVGYLAGRRAGTNAFERTWGPGMMPRMLTPMPSIPGVPRMTPRAGMPFTGQGALVMNVVQGSPAEAAGLERGDIILALDDQVLDAENDLPAVLAGYEPGDMVNLTVRRQNEELQLPVQLGTNPDASVTTPWLGIGYTMLTPDE